jgi:ATP-dependent DNA ligase
MPLIGQKAHEFSEDLVERLGKRRIQVFPAVMEPKINGLRALITVGGGQIPVIRSFAGNIVTSMPEVTEQLWEISKQMNLPSSMVLDGEAEIPGVPFEESSGAFRTKDDRPKGLILHLFDVQMVNSLWQARKTAANTFAELASRYFGNDVSIRSVPYQQVHDITGVMKAYDGFLEDGWEGAMVKLPGFGYQFSRHWSWMKLKEERTCEAVITGAVEGKGKYVGMLGALECITINGPNLQGEGESGGVPVSCSGHMSDADRQNLWRMHKEGKLANQIVEIAYQMPTRYGNMRHPRLLRFRPMVKGVAL